MKGVSCLVNRFAALDGQPGVGVEEDMLEQFHAVPTQPSPNQPQPQPTSNHPTPFYVRTSIETLPTRTKLSLRLKDPRTGQSGTTSVLLDCGATSEFLDPRYVRKRGLTTRKLP